MYSGRKLITVFFLAWTLLDLSVPGLCQTDFALPSDQGSQLVSLTQVNLISVDHSQPSPGRSSSNEGDCFCCCRHIAPTRSFVSAIHLQSSIGEILSDSEHILEFFTAPYHPPRT